MRLKWILITALCLVVCSSSIVAQEVYVDGNVLAFTSYDAFERYASSEYDRGILQYYADSSYDLTTLGELQGGGETEEDLYPDFLNMVLNQDYIVRISSFLVKVDLYGGFGMAINANEPNAYWSLQNNDYWAPNMLYFDGESENMLETLEMYESGWMTARVQPPRLSEIEKDRAKAKAEGRRPVAPRVATNSCPGASREKCDGLLVWDQVDNGPNPGCIYWMYGMDYKVVYQKALIYFSLQSKQKSKQACSSTNWIGVPNYDAQLRLAGRVRYRKRCGGEVSKVDVLNDFGDEQNWRPYEGSRSLSHYDFGVTFGIAHSGQPITDEATCSIISGYAPTGGGTATHAGMTWTAIENRTGVVHVGSDNVTNPYNGDTAPTASLPVLCLRVDNSPAPSNVSPDFYNGWARGPVALTPAVAGSTLTSPAAADSLCASHFGAGWRMAEFHDGRYGPSLQYGGGWSFWAFGNIPVGTRFWTHINDQPANPWN